MELANAYPKLIFNLRFQFHVHVSPGDFNSEYVFLTVNWGEKTH